MAKRFSGLEFWEQRFKTLQQSQNATTNTKDDSTRPEKILGVSFSAATTPTITQPITPISAKPMEQAIQSQPLIIQNTSAVHNVRDSLTVLPSPAHPSQCAPIFSSNDYVDRDELFFGGSKNESANKKFTLNTPFAEYKPQRPILNITTTNSTTARPSQKHSIPPKLSSSGDYRNIHTYHQPLFSESFKYEQSLADEMDRAFEALTNAL